MIENHTTKICCICRQPKPATLEFFGRQRRDNDDLLRRECLACRRKVHLGGPRGEAPPTHKTCTGCKEVKLATVDFFYPRNDRKYGFMPRCKACQLEKARVKDYVKPQTEIDPSVLKTCKRCKNAYPATTTFFCYPKANRKDRGKALIATCKQCQHEIRTTEENREKMRALRDAAKARDLKLYNMKYRLKAARRRKKLRENGMDKITPEQIDALVARFKGRCFYCDKDASERYELDHLLPVALGGKHTIENLVIACPSCNRRKWKHPPEVFINQVLAFS